MPALSVRHDAPACLDALCNTVRTAQRNAARHMLDELAMGDADTRGMLAHLPESLRAGRPDTYLRHIAYSDPNGSFTIFYLVWRPGQASPVHGHKTWCTYRVLQGELQETHYRWDAAHGVALPAGNAVRKPGKAVTATAGLEQIHRLHNASDGIAISLHIYGVALADAQTGVNHLVQAA
ncbi:cysteine dioxygenase [Bordetella petrii]|uniref:cysteine dioxygenase family protein n=1 Tax=Bordetella petrii TaxID=94624 RepID=UPI003AF40720